ncbi:hypothetical protein LOK49_LG01G01764 [Camellia lanceoleosa]|uniref:Uncharacterized protein n=1 Tax=Camellia lanceoleosa TaxID=1840588 RepID=A0ACC0ISA1_9ERIC|nr:hypothetical protein LOK49_LG01G01764 [Camellia lanceoleosa]
MPTNEKASEVTTSIIILKDEIDPKELSLAILIFERPLVGAVNHIRSLYITDHLDGVPVNRLLVTQEGIKHSLIRQEDGIIFSLLERAQYCFNVDTYDPNAFFMDGLHGLVDFMVKETEKLHARVRIYKSPDEHPFFPNDLPNPMLPPLQYPQVLHPIADAININNKI